MKKFFIIFGLVLGISSLAYATMFCCPPDKTPEQCCAERGKMYCENDGKCRTRCRDVTPPECIGGLSILRESVVCGVRQQRYVQKWGNAKKS